MSTSGTSAGSFTGSSLFASSLAQQLQNAVNIASIPMDNLQTEQTTLQNQESEFGTLSSDFTALSTALTSIDSATGSSSYGVTISNTKVASASVGSGVLAGTYSLTVTSPGANTNTISNDSGLLTVTDPTQQNLSTSTSFTLLVGPSGDQTQYNITDSTGTLDGLANAINSSGANVQATVVNVGSSSSPDYRLSVQSLDFAPDTVQLEDNGNNNADMLTQLGSGGSYVQYSVNGEPSVNSSSQSLTLSTGLTVNVLGTGATSITVSQNGDSIANALSNFANAYNAALADVNKNRGQNGGALTGDSSIFSLTEALNNLGGYSGSTGSVASLANLGLTFDPNGNLDFNASTFDQAASSNMTDVLNFLGSVSGSTGFLGAANNILTGITDPLTGLLPQATQNISTEINNIGTQITNDQSQVTQLQQTLQAQLSAADASIASLEQQANYFQMMFQTQNADAQLGY
jgi:flagellar hook-associated protein 2